MHQAVLLITLLGFCLAKMPVTPFSPAPTQSIMRSLVSTDLPIEETTEANGCKRSQKTPPITQTL